MAFNKGELPPLSNRHWHSPVSSRKGVRPLFWLDFVCIPPVFIDNVLTVLTV